MVSESQRIVSRRRFLSLAGVSGIAAVAGPVGAYSALAASLSTREADRAAATKYLSIRGHDLSTLQQVEAAGRVFADVGGKVRPVEQIVKRHGANYVRLRLWVDPPIPYNDLPHVLTMAKRIKAAGLSLLLDFHYSDFWADAGKQPTPKRWQGQDLSTLAQTVHDYTQSVLTTLDKQGTPPQMVQIGNEITSGMLWPQGQIYLNGAQRWDEFTVLLKAGIAGARDAITGSGAPQIMVHIDRGGDNPGARYFYDHILPLGVHFDVIGLSYYPWWHGPLASLKANLHDLAHAYGKGIVVVETAYPWTLKDGDGYANNVGPSDYLYTKYPATPKGQLGYLHNLISVVEQTPDGHGLGMMYWEPAWIPGVGWEPGSGDAWDNLTLFNFKGHALPGIKAYHVAARKPASR